MTRDNSYLIGNQYAVGHKPNRGSFKKGLIPWNKNLKGIHLSPGSEFKKGQVSINWTPVGTITTRIDKSKFQRKFIKISEPNNWIEYAKVVWMQNNGLIPKGYIIHHINRNTLDDVIDNLALVTRKAHFEIHEIGKMGRKALKKKLSTRLAL